eukprot:524970_1
MAQFNFLNFCFLNLFMVIINCNCKFGELDLTPLSTLLDPIQCIYFNADKTWLYLTRLCTNALTCDTTGDAGMVLQMKADSDDVCGQPLAYWDNGMTKPSNNHKNEWIFEYKNGYHETKGCSNGRHLTLSIICDSSANPYDIAKTSCYEGETIDDYCPYYLTIYTHLACVGNGYETNSLSGGSIFLISFFTIFIFYLIIGYSIGYYKTKNVNIIDNFPNYSFWISFVSFTKIGCQVSYAWTMSKLTQSDKYVSTL